ncbi:FAD-dependent oxidoreductase [Sphingomonas histidinilytica]|uniref:Succinate dehydrogenase/fumarate reductase, flavoprotein subunit n=1 Tax=Rhizorhabdus histidinilytica TaxID=439228 RepID=A0A1T5GUL0_9SPHN|nr:FAD-dependent oxidoreductase [Rhizorhabdus histidinilytica]MBO9380679.1 FAD-dependent oxidoreductase [Rhizorhabdus histidinilytica]SKC12142.1 Succinate dehydrogenase/fumarate reductase, flavoprotein subunit [Rhizorhabdus histidinilytica]
MNTPLPLNQIGQFDDEADVVILGYGIAGACAALEARGAGGDVLVVERASGGGGASALSSGIFYIGAGTEVQKAAGYDDTPDNMYRSMIASMGPDQAELIRPYCDGNVEHFRWLEAQGIPFERSYYPEKTVFLMTTHGLMWSGNEKVWPFRDAATPAPRGHQVAMEGDTSGAAAMFALLARCDEAGVRASFDSIAQSLIVDGEGRVCGVTVRQFGQERHYRARRGVIVATGGFGRNEQMLARYFPGLPDTAEPMGIPHTDGSGITMAVAAGGDVRGMDGLIATASIYPPPQLVKGIIVNRLGKRFVAEDAYHGRTASFIMEQPDQRAFLIVDSEIFAYPEIIGANHSLVDGYESIEAMESGLELPPGSLADTLAVYNQQAAQGRDPLFEKHTDWLKPLTDGPWAAFDISFNRSTYYYITLGGLRIGPDARVRRADGGVVAGLYAAGACTAHLSPDGKSYASGMSLGPGSFFGRVAGREAMRGSAAS